ncbi:hypothetical protein nbrc107696_07750 [Gordonia spumicola]|uniref:Pyrrolo-quinoline quinone repeat domain-containing protein n=1 Tax=Gordonia spumicola TaxID=589161 RepID=A0A7I9V4H5_9ACTN|nr:PQQ-binding-like beta-propeller repeat protein [Gordonia spumicola]GEE00329.1 hypothetical protein nbrc107696_07750 [Gordonia spumicola]
MSKKPLAILLAALAVLVVACGTTDAPHELAAPAPLATVCPADSPTATTVPTFATAITRRWSVSADAVLPGGRWDAEWFGPREMCGRVVATAVRGLPKSDTTHRRLVDGDRVIAGIDARTGTVAWTAPLLRGARCGPEPVRGTVACIVDNESTNKTYCAYADLTADDPEPLAPCDAGRAPGVQRDDGVTIQYVRIDSGTSGAESLDVDSAVVDHNAIVTASTPSDDGRRVVVERRATPYARGWRADVATTPIDASEPWRGVVTRVAGPAGFLGARLNSSDHGAVLDADTGRVVVDAPGTGPDVAATSVPGRRLVVFSDTDTTGLDATGRVLWKRQGRRSPRADYSTAERALYRVVVTPSGDTTRTVALDAETGGDLPSAPAAMPGYPDAPPSAFGSDVGAITTFTSTSGYETLGLTYHYHGAMDARTGRVLWSAKGRFPQTEAADDGVDTMLLQQTSSNGSNEVRALDLRAGTIRWRATVAPFAFFTAGLSIGDAAVTSYTVQ